MTEAAYSQVFLSVLVVFAIPMGQLLVEWVALLYITREGERPASGESATWQDYVRGLQHVRGYPLCIVGLFAAIVISFRYEDINTISQSFSDDPVRAVTIMLILCFTLWIATTYLARRLYTVEVEGLADKLKERNNRRKRHTIDELGNIRRRVRRWIVGFLGALTLFVPLYVAFGTY